jgi:hypothetical protein
MGDLEIDEQWKEASNWISLRHSPYTPRFHGCGLPKSFEIFDWVIWSELDARIDKMEAEEPKKILCASHPKCIKTLLEKSDFSSKPSLVIAGMDTLLSTVIDDVLAMSGRFSNIYYEAKDVESDVIKSFSMGFISYYLKDAKPANIQKAIEYSDNSTKTESVLAAWGQRWKFLDDKIDDRRSADIFLSSQNYLSRKSIPFEDYWQELAKYQFLLAPRGQGIQSPKLAEAWMVKAIPIVTKTPCFLDLKNLGYPLILIDEWEEVTPENIEKWQAYYGQVDWQLTRNMLTNSYLNALL